MGLLFGGAGGDQVSITAAASINNMAAGTILAWVNPTSLVSNSCIYGKRTSANSRVNLNLSGTGGNISFSIGRAVSNAGHTSTNTPLSTTNKWYCVCATWDFAAGTVCQLYVGDLTTPLTLVSGTPSNGSGAQGNESGANALVGNDDALSRPWNGPIATFMMFNVALTQAQAIALQWKPQLLSSAVVYFECGFNGTGTQPDWSGTGNSGTVTTATVTSHVPLRAPFGEYRGLWQEIAGSPPPSGSVVFRTSASGLGTRGGVRQPLFG